MKGGVAVDKGVAFFGNYAGQFYAVDADERPGEVDSAAQRASSFGRAGSIYSTPAVAYGRVYAGNIDSRVYSFSEKTGEVAWSQSTGAEVYSAPAVADDARDARPRCTSARWTTTSTRSTRRRARCGGSRHRRADPRRRERDRALVYVSVIGPNIGTFGYNVKTGKKDCTTRSASTTR